MSLLIKRGVTRLSELVIDADKDWGAFGITNLKELAALMGYADINYRGVAVLQGLVPGIAGQYLKTQGAGSPPMWDDLPGNRFERASFLALAHPAISLIVAEDHSGGAFTATPARAIPAPPALALAAAEDHSGGGFTSTPTLAIPSPTDLNDAIRLYERYQSGDDDQKTIQGVNWEAQTFTPGANHTINRFFAKILRVASPGNVTLSIRATAAGLPDGADLIAATINGNAVSLSALLTLFNLAAGDALTSGTKYAAVLRDPSGDINNYILWRCDQTSPSYAGGARCYSSDSGANWAEEITRDFLFEEGNGVT